MASRAVAARGYVPFVVLAPLVVAVTVWAATDTTWRAYVVPVLAVAGLVAVWPGGGRRERLAFGLSFVGLVAVWLGAGAPGIQRAVVVAGGAVLAAAVVWCVDRVERTTSDRLNAAHHEQMRRLKAEHRDLVVRLHREHQAMITELERKLRATTAQPAAGDAPAVSGRRQSEPSGDAATDSAARRPQRRTGFATLRGRSMGRAPDARGEESGLRSPSVAQPIRRAPNGFDSGAPKHRHRDRDVSLPTDREERPQRLRRHPDNVGPAAAIRRSPTPRSGGRYSRGTVEGDRHPVIRIVRSRGVLIGDRGKQVNEYTIRMRLPELSFAQVLRLKRVRYALRLLARTPQDADARARAVKAIRLHAVCRGPALRYRMPQAKVRFIRARSSEPGHIVVDRSSRIVIGDRRRQRNRFTLRADRVEADVGALLRDCRAVAEALVDAVVSGRTGRLERSVQERFGHTMRAAPDDRLSVRVTPSESRSLEIIGARGAVVGDNVEVQNEVRPRIGRIRRFRVPSLDEVAQPDDRQDGRPGSGGRAEDLGNDRWLDEWLEPRGRTDPTPGRGLDDFGR